MCMQGGKACTFTRTLRQYAQTIRSDNALNRYKLTLSEDLACTLPPVVQGAHISGALEMTMQFL